MTTELKKLSAYTPRSAVANGDLFFVSANTTGTAVSGTVAANTILKSGLDIVSANAVVTDLYVSNTFTPSNSSITVESGRFWYDSDYIYIATSANTVKRAALNSF